MYVFIWKIYKERRLVCVGVSGENAWAVLIADIAENLFHTNQLKKMRQLLNVIMDAMVNQQMFIMYVMDVARKQNDTTDR